MRVFGKLMRGLLAERPLDSFRMEAGHQRDQGILGHSALPLHLQGGEELEIELITNHQWFNQTCLCKGAPIKPSKQ